MDGRELAFCDSRFRDFAPVPGTSPAEGPFASEKDALTLGAVAAWLGGNGGGPTIDWPVFSHPSGSPDQATLPLGLTLFTQTLGLRRGDGLGRLLRIGDALWLAHLQERDTDGGDQDTGEEDDGRPEEPFAWTPERIAGALQRTLLSAARAVRRARWLCWLSESSIAWKPCQGQEKPFRVLEISQGAIVASGSLPQGGEVPVPPDHRRDRRSRQEVFDLETFDRLAVLTTELKRLTAAGRSPRVRFGRRILEGRALAAALRWV